MSPKLSAEQVSEIRRRLDAGERQADLAREYGVASRTIKRALDRGAPTPAGPERAAPAPQAQSIPQRIVSPELAAHATVLRTAASMIAERAERDTAQDIELGARLHRDWGDVAASFGMSPLEFFAEAAAFFVRWRADVDALVKLSADCQLRAEEAEDEAALLRAEVDPIRRRQRWNHEIFQAMLIARAGGLNLTVEDLKLLAAEP